MQIGSFRGEEKVPTSLSIVNSYSIPLKLFCLDSEMEESALFFCQFHIYIYQFMALTEDDPLLGVR